MDSRTVYAVASNRTERAAQLFDDLVRCETRVYNALNDHLRERHGLVTSQFEFLRHLRDHPGARVADLAATFAVGVGATSKGIDRLVRYGWVERVPHPTDRRSSVLALTPTGTALLNDADKTFLDCVAELIAPAGAPGQLKLVGEYFNHLRGILESAQTGTPVG